MANKDIIFFGGIDWFNKRKLPPHHVVNILSRINRIFYMDNFGGIRDLTLRDSLRVFKKLKFVFLYKNKKHILSENKQKKIMVHQPIIIPTARFPRTLGKINNILLKRELTNLVNKYQIKNPIIWTRVPTQLVWDSIKKLNYKLLVYQSVDNFPYSPQIPVSLRPQFAKSEKMFCRKANLIFASGQGLYKKKRTINPNTYFFPNGVEQGSFSKRFKPINFFKKIKKPVIGFAGALGPWIDYRLLYESAKIKSEWSFVFLGPKNKNIKFYDLDKLPNVYFPGIIEHSKLTFWFKYFNVGLIPYLINEFTRYTFPAKMAEYFAEGIPVVSTPLPEIMYYSHIVRIINNSKEMIASIQQELNNTDQEHHIMERRQIAKSLSWETIVSKMDKLIDKAFCEIK